MPFARLLINLLPARWQKLTREALKFGIVGGLNTVVNFAVFNLLILTIFANGQLKANVAATVVATTTSYFMNRHWTFRDRPKSAIRREYVLFFAFNAAGLVIELAVLGLFKYGLGLTSVLALNIAKAAGIGMGTVFRFWSYRTFVFKPAVVAAVPAVAAAAATTAFQPRAGADPVAAEFDELTGPLELAPAVDAELEAEIDAAELEAELDAADLDVADARTPARPS
jgi:putative flippase GtrA